MKYKTLILCSAMVALPLFAIASPESTSPAYVIMVRPYNSGSIYIQLDSNVLCDTSVFMIDGNNAGKDIMYSAALSALVAKKKVRVEALTSTGCTGWGTRLQSLYLLAE